MTVVLLVANWLDDLGGVQTATRSLAGALRGAGAEVRLASAFPAIEPLGGARTGPALFSETPWRALSRAVSALAGDTRWGRIDPIARRRAVRRLEKLAVGVDAVVAMDVFAAELVAATRLTGIRRFLQYHNTFSNIEGTRDLQRVMRASARFSGVVALTEADADGFRAHLRVPVRAIPNALEIARGRVARTERLVVGLGRLTGTKNFSMLFDAWDRIPADQRDGWRMELHGDGPERGALEDRAPSDARVMGTTDDPAAVLDRAALLVLPSLHEGLPMVLLEAMASDVACIATRSSPGVEELLGDGAGWLVPLGDVGALSRTLTFAMNNPTERDVLADRARGRLGRYAPTAVAQQWLDLISLGSEGS